MTDKMIYKSSEFMDLEYFECSCGFHMALDATFLLQVGDLVVPCPNPGCKGVCDTGVGQEQPYYVDEPDGNIDEWMEENAPEWANL